MTTTQFMKCCHKCQFTKITKPIKLMKSHISSGESGIMVDAVRYRWRETGFAMIHN